MDIKRYKTIVRIGGVYDLAVTFPFAIPYLASTQIALLASLNQYLGFSGAIPAFEPLHLLFINLFGTIVSFWSVLRIHKGEPIFGLYDGVGRLLFASLMIFYLINYHVSQIVVLFLVPEIIFGVIQLYGYWRLQRSENKLKLEQYESCIK